MDPENEDTVYREYYRKDPDTLEWYMADQGKWISEEEWLQAYTEEWTTDMLDHTFHNTQPICGLLDITPKTVEVITKEYQDGKTCYTIIYNNKYKQVAGSLENSDEIKEAKTTESYTINEYGVLTEYERIETGTIKATNEPCTMHHARLTHHPKCQQRSHPVRNTVPKKPIPLLKPIFHNQINIRTNQGEWQAGEEFPISKRLPF